MHKISFSQWSTGTGGNILSDLRKLQTYLETEFFIWKIWDLMDFTWECTNITRKNKEYYQLFQFKEIFIIERFTCNSIVNFLVLNLLKTPLGEKERIVL